MNPRKSANIVNLELYKETISKKRQSRKIEPIKQSSETVFDALWVALDDQDDDLITDPKCQLWVNPNEKQPV